MQFRRPTALAEAKLDPTAGEQIERRHPLRHPVRLIGGDLDDAVAKPDVLGPLAGGAQENLGRGGMGIFLQEMMFDFPRVVVAQLVRELDLRQRILHQLVLAVRLPGLGQLVLVENSEFHGLDPLRQNLFAEEI